MSQAVALGVESERRMRAKTSATDPSGAGVSLPQRLLDLLFPPRCVHCQRTGAPLCAACASTMREPAAPRCIRCDRSLAPLAGPHCPLCAALLREADCPAIERIIVACDYQGAASSAIRALKFRGQRRLAQPLALALADATRRAALTIDIIIPMPLHAARRRERGYNQATLLARTLASVLSAPMRDDLLARVRATQPQTRLNRRERQANVAGAFALTAPAAARLVDQRVALVDDVTTTGATLEAAAEALRAARPTAIYALAVARPMLSITALTSEDALDL